LRQTLVPVPSFGCRCWDASPSGQANITAISERVGVLQGIGVRFGAGPLIGQRQRCHCHKSLTGLQPNRVSALCFPKGMCYTWLLERCSPCRRSPWPILCGIVLNRRSLRRRTQPPPPPSAAPPMKMPKRPDSPHPVASRPPLSQSCPERSRRIGSGGWGVRVIFKGVNQ
jgi:hypothetical protein